MLQFDPYYKWLGISPKDQPPHHYRLLGIDLFEDDLEVIEAAADRHMAYVQQCAIGEYVKESQQILNELSAARVCLLVPETKEEYDTQLRDKLGLASDAEIISTSSKKVPLTKKREEKRSDNANIPPRKQKRERTTTRKPSGVDVRSLRMVWIVAGGVCLLFLVIMFASQFMDGDDTPPTETEIAKAQPLSPITPTPVIKPTMPAPDWSTFNQPGGSLLHTFTGHSKSVNCVAVTPDGKPAISGSDDKTLKVWDINSGELLRTLTGHSSSVNCVAVTPDGKQAIFGSDDRTLKVWDINSGKLLRTLTGHSGFAYCVALTPDGKQAISGSFDSTLKVWDINNGKLLHTLTGHSGWIRCVALTPDGKQAISGSDDKTLKVWDISSGKLIATYRLDDRVNDLAISQDGETLIVGGGSGRLHKLTMMKPGETTE